MKNFRLLATGAPVAALQAALARQPELWTLDRYWKDHPQPIFREVDSIFLRMVARAPYFYASEAEKQEAMRSIDPWEANDEAPLTRLPEALPLIYGLMTMVQGERLGRVLLDRLEPGAHILPHPDIPRELKYYERFHIVVSTNPSVDFRAGDEHQHMGAGEIWWFDNTEEHEVWNRGTTDRVHLIIDIRKKGYSQ